VQETQGLHTVNPWAISLEKVRRTSGNGIANLIRRGSSKERAQQITGNRRTRYRNHPKCIQKVNRCIEIDVIGWTTDKSAHSDKELLFQEPSDIMELLAVVVSGWIFHHTASDEEVFTAMFKDLLELCGIYSGVVEKVSEILIHLRLITTNRIQADDLG
jgi:hypothetical protein